MTGSGFNFLSQLNAAHLPKSRPITSWKGFSVHTLDMRSLKLNLGAFVPFLVLESKKQPAGSELLSDLIDFSREFATGPTVYVSGGPVSSDVLDSSDLERYSIAILDGETIEAFQKTRDQEAKYRILASAMARTVGYAGHSVLQKRVGQFGTAPVEMRIDQAWEKRETGSIERFPGRSADIAFSTGRNDPVAFDHHYGVFSRRAASAIDESRACNDDRCD